VNSPESNINIGELNAALSKNVILYNPTRIDYTINDFELTQLEEYGKSIWKDAFLTSIGIAIPTLINGYVAQNKLEAKTGWTTEVFLNYLIGGIAVSISVLTFITWQMNRKKVTKILSAIKDKPQFTLPRSESI
jgi:hypothetical protein